MNELDKLITELRSGAINFDDKSKDLICDFVMYVIGENYEKGVYMTYSSLTPVMQDFSKEIKNSLLEDLRYKVKELNARS